MKDIEQQIVSIIGKSITYAALYLFGSQAKGLTTRHSDIDIAILCNTKSELGEIDRIALQQELSDELGKECDLVVLNDASPILSTQVLKNGKLIDAPNKRQLDEFILTNISKYFDLKMVRAVIEKNILRGRTHGR